ncbi:MAG: 2-alkenal reductase [Ignavibacteriae bacterium HGW-Ignavibacteriae-3]|nr:MAG: 2-alkenal reductase [Ignavibacteriae bacterium HGW-Ignavibacteriae-3]
MHKLKPAMLSAATTLILTAIIFSITLKNDSTGRFESLSSLLGSTPSTSVQRSPLNADITYDRQNVITKTVARVSPAVVGINVTEMRQYRDVFSQDPIWRQFFGDRVYNQQVKMLGSGTIISPDGYIVTNDHVAGNATEAIVTMTDGTQHDAKVIGTDRTSDICLLKIDAKNLPYIRLGDSDNIIIGEWVIALGNPFGLFDINDKPSVTVGVVSANGMNLGTVDNRYYVNMLQTDAAINNGNSGGPLVNALGELIGINTLIYTAQGSSGNIGVSFAIPVNKIERVVSELKSKGKVERDFWTGLKILTITEQIQKAYNLSASRGVIITEITKNSPAQKSDLQVGDIIIGLNSWRINDENTLGGIIQEFRTGDTVDIKILRDKKTIIKKMKLEKMK